MNADPKDERREAKRRKQRYGMQVSGRSTKTVLLRVLTDKTLRAREETRRGA